MELCVTSQSSTDNEDHRVRAARRAVVRVQTRAPHRKPHLRHHHAAGQAQGRAGAAPVHADLLAERLTLQVTEHFTTAAMDRGTELEPSARAFYELTTGRTVREVGFCLDDGGRWGCSPDGLMDDAGLEIKCPGKAGFVDVAESGALPDDHALQCQFGLWVTGLSRWDYVLFADVRGLQSQIIEVRPDAKLHAAFAEILPAFCDELDAMEAKMRAAGHGYTPPVVIVKSEEQQRQEDIADGNPFA